MCNFYINEDRIFTKLRVGGARQDGVKSNAGTEQNGRRQHSGHEHKSTASRLRRAPRNKFNKVEPKLR